jgi:hypothetical protein
MRAHADVCFGSEAEVVAMFGVCPLFHVKRTSPSHRPTPVKGQELPLRAWQHLLSRTAITGLKEEAGR